MNGVVNHDESSAYDGVADDYEVARPGYPADVFDTIEHYGDFNEPPRVVEVGSGTGQATRQMTARGWTVHGIEPGPRLAETARTHVPCPNTRFEVTRFEDAVLTESSFDLVAAATSWHWVETDIGYRKAHSLLKPSGKIALFWNAHVPHTTNPAREPIRDAYLDVAPELADLAPLTPDRLDYDPEHEIRTSGYFDLIERHVFDFEWRIQSTGSSGSSTPTPAIMRSILADVRCSIVVCESQQTISSQAQSPSRTRLCSCSERDGDNPRITTSHLTGDGRANRHLRAGALSGRGSGA